jgi:hypothetical protein
MKNIFFILIATITFSCSSTLNVPNIQDCTIPERTEQETELLNNLLKHAVTDIQCECYNELTNRLFMLVQDCQITYEYYIHVLEEIVINLDNIDQFYDLDFDICSIQYMDYILFEGSDYEF